MAHPFASSYLLFLFLYYLSFTSSAFSDQLSSSFASTQIKFWSENVNNKMPAAISTKLSPLTKQDSDYYTKTITQNNFKADTQFCSLAKLACSTAINEIKAVIKPHQAKVYANKAVIKPHQAKVYENKAVIKPHQAKVYETIKPHQAKVYENNKAAIPLEEVDPFSFFRLSILREGDTIHLSNLKESLPYRAFLPPQIASKISLRPKEIIKIFPESSKEAIDTTLSYCNAPAIKGESKACLKSLEEMISFSKTALGKSKLLALTSKSTTGSGKEFTIKKIKQFNVEKIIACHEMFLPFATYFCHSLSSSRIYSVDFVEPKTGAPVNTVLAICHMDTSSWPENHVAFKILKFGPGQGEACHWLDEIDLAWIAGGENI